MDQDFERAAHLRDQSEKLRKEKEQQQKQWREKAKETDGVVDEEVIAEVVSKMTGVPLKKVGEDETKRLLNMEAELHNTVISQDEAVHAIAKAVRKSRSGMKDPKRPIGSFIFAGPTGVGKTLLAKQLAKFMFGDENNIVQLDMSEYMEKHNVSRLVGAPPGYIGYEEGGQLTEKIRRKPYSVVLQEHHPHHDHQHRGRDDRGAGSDRRVPDRGPQEGHRDQLPGHEEEVAGADGEGVPAGVP
jgi:ATP-dependent Clp protease ATP-binding subunit ClpC